jgi:hypothetical protein
MTQPPATRPLGLTGAAVHRARGRVRARAEEPPRVWEESEP